jgi:hypothetical protein
MAAIKRYYSPGDRIEFSFGEWSDFDQTAMYKILEPFDLVKSIEKYKGEVRTQRNFNGTEEYFHTRDCARWLTNNLPLRKITVNHVYLGSYELKTEELEFGDE